MPVLSRLDSGRALLSQVVKEWRRARRNVDAASWWSGRCAAADVHLPATMTRPEIAESAEALTATGGRLVWKRVEGRVNHLWDGALLAVHGRHFRPLAGARRPLRLIAVYWWTARLSSSTRPVRRAICHELNSVPAAAIRAAIPAMRSKVSMLPRILPWGNVSPRAGACDSRGAARVDPLGGPPPPDGFPLERRPPCVRVAADWRLKTPGQYVTGALAFGHDVGRGRGASTSRSASSAVAMLRSLSQSSARTVVARPDRDHSSSG